MKAYICDRCKLYYTEPKKYSDLPMMDSVPISQIGISTFTRLADSNAKTYDICPDCAKSFISWFKTPERDDRE